MNMKKYTVEYTTIPTNDVEYDICNHWFHKEFNSIKEARTFYSDIVKKAYNVTLSTFKGSSLVILESSF